MKGLWLRYYLWTRRLSPGEQAILIVVLLILFSIWLIFDVTH